MMDNFFSLNSLSIFEMLFSHLLGDQTVHFQDDEKNYDIVAKVSVSNQCSYNQCYQFSVMAMP